LKQLAGKVYDSLGKLVDVLSIGMTGVMFILIAYQIFSRWLFNNGATAANEISNYLFVWVVYFGMVVAAKDREHINVGIVVDMFAPRMRAFSLAIAQLLWLYFDVYVCISSIQLIQSMLRLGSKTGVLRIMLAYIYLVLPITFIWSLIYITRDLIGHVKTLLAKGGEDA